MIRMISNLVLLCGFSAVSQWLLRSGRPASRQLLMIFLCVDSFSLPALASSAAASDSLLSDSLLSKKGMYVGARLGYAYNRNSCVDTAIECDRDAAGYGIFSGYDFNDAFSLELSATRLGDTSAIYPNISLQGELSTIDLSIKYTRPLYKNIQAFGKLGVAYWDGEISGWEDTLKDSGERPAVGAGIQFPFFIQLDGRLEYQYFDQLGNKWMGYTDAHVFSFALVWSFSTTRK